MMDFVWKPSSFLSRVCEAKWKTGSTGYDTFGALALGFYNEAATHLPFVMAVHNLWRAKLLYSLNYGHPSFRSRDSKKVQKILFEAGKGSHAESMYEAGPQSVTQVLQSNWTLNECIIGVSGVHSHQYRQAQRDPDLLAHHIGDVVIMGSGPVLSDLETCRQSRSWSGVDDGFTQNLAVRPGLRLL